MSYEDFRNEYIDFTSKWDELKKTVACVYNEFKKREDIEGNFTCFYTT